MPYPALDIAKYMVTYCISKNTPISNLKLQKILYFAWIEYYREKNVELFLEDICAWQFGPVVPGVYYEFCVYGGLPISQEYKVVLAPDDKGILDGIIDKYNLQPVGDLVDKTHRPGKPWSLTYRNGIGNRMPIPFSNIIKLECR